MTAEGYLPTRDEMVAIHHAAEKLRRDALRWQGYYKFANCPSEIGNLIVLQAIFDLERALNPDYYPFENPQRGLTETRAWDLNVIGGFYWIRNLNNVLIERLSIQSISTADTFARWKQFEQVLPEAVSIPLEELDEIEFATELLKPVLDVYDPTNERSPRKVDQRASGHAKSSENCRVSFTPRGDKFWIDGEEASRLNLAGFHVVKALHEAGPEGLNLEGLTKICSHPDARGIVDRIREKDPETWGTVLLKAGVKGNNYRLAFTVGREATAANHTTSSTPTRRKPHNN